MPEMSVNALKANLSNPQRDFLWEILIPSPIGDGEVQVYNLRAQSTTIPARGQGAIPIPFKQTAGIMVPGKLSFDHEWACTFIEGEDKKVWDAINSWMNKVVNVGTGVGEGDSEIKTDIYLTLIEVGGDISLKLKLKGCYPKSLEAVPLSYETEAIVKYPVTFSFDYVETSS